MATGAGVCGLLYKDGAIIATDTLISYGSFAKWPHTERVYAPTDELAMAGGGLLADFQYISSQVDQIVAADRVAADGNRHAPSDLFSAIANLFYHRRSKARHGRDLYMINLVAAGFDKRSGKPFLGIAAPDGNQWSSDYAGTDTSGFFTVPLLREWAEAHPVETRTREQCEAALEEVMTVAYSKICTAGAQMQLTHVDANGVTISPPKDLRPRWDYKLFDMPSTQYQ